MTDTAPAIAETEDHPVAIAINEKGLEFVIANDLPRLWTTGAQSFVNDQHTMIVFREQNLLQGPDGEPTAIVRNVASLVMPTEIAVQLYFMLGEQLRTNGNLDSE